MKRVSNLTIRSSREVYPLRIARSSGYVSHYLHFIMDFVWPIFHWLDNDVGWLGDETVAISSMEPGPLFFDRIFLEIFGLPLLQGTVAGRIHVSSIELSLTFRAALNVAFRSG